MKKITCRRYVVSEVVYTLAPLPIGLACIGQLLLKRTFLFLIIGSIFLSACRKETSFVPLLNAESCQVQTAIPGGRSYNSDSIVPVDYNKKICGFLPLSKKNYWVYSDSIFNNGTFLKVQYDTLRYASTFKSLSDSLIWWESNISVGLPLRLYTTETSLFEIESRFFNPDFGSKEIMLQQVSTLVAFHFE